MNPIDLGKFIASLRNEKNLTQEELAEILFIDKRKISRWECGTSIPEFEMLIKLSEILDVSLYELSICKRIENEKLTRKIINKFKSIKDYKYYQRKKKIKFILLIIIAIIFIITTTYTIKYHNTFEVYQLDSIDNNYYFDGKYIRANKLNMFYINDINLNDKEMNSNCEYSCFSNSNRIFDIISNNNHQLYYETKNNIELEDILTIKIKCMNNKKENNYQFNIKLTKKYDNKLL